MLKFIYFDVGGVAVKDFSKTNKWIELMDGLEIPISKGIAFEELFKTYEKGICIGDDITLFQKEATKTLGVSFRKNYDMTADFVNRFEKNPPFLELLNSLKQKYKIGLLTGEYPGMLNMIFQKQLLPDDIWDVIIDTSVVHLHKSEPEIYQLAEKLSGVKSTEILFVDNQSKAFTYPLEMGWLVFEYDPSDVVTSTRALQNYIREIDHK